ncbi:MAG: energy transducer TonB [Luteolibacter sp.]
MTAIFHALNIGTLACWLSVVGFGAVAFVVPGMRGGVLSPPIEEEPSPFSEDFTLGEVADSGAELTEQAPSAAPAETLPAPPELPEIFDFSPLPEIPEIAIPTAKPAPSVVAAAVAAKPPTTQPRRTASNASTSARSGGGGASGTSSSGSANGQPGSGMSDASRLAKGRMPKPAYPAQAKRSGQTGTVVVEFTVDASGRVISAFAKSSSGWPLLDTEAVRTVRRWTFPAGGIMKLQRPIVFQLR